MLGATVQYRASHEAAFDAVVRALKTRGYVIVASNHDRGSITFAPHDITWWIRAAGFQVEIRVVDRGGGIAEITTASGTPVDMGETDKVTGKVFHELDKLLGPGTLISGKLVRPDVTSEFQRFVFVLVFFVVIIAIFFLVVWIRGLPLIR